MTSRRSRRVSQAADAPRARRGRVLNAALTRRRASPPEQRPCRVATSEPGEQWQQEDQGRQGNGAEPAVSSCSNTDVQRLIEDETAREPPQRVRSAAKAYRRVNGKGPRRSSMTRRSAASLGSGDVRRRRGRAAGGQKKRESRQAGSFCSRVGGASPWPAFPRRPAQRSSTAVRRRGGFEYSNTTPAEPRSYTGRRVRGGGRAKSHVRGAYGRHRRQVLAGRPAKRGADCCTRPGEGIERTRGRQAQRIIRRCDDELRTEAPRRSTSRRPRAGVSRGLA